MASAARTIRRQMASCRRFESRKRDAIRLSLPKAVLPWVYAAAGVDCCKGAFVIRGEDGEKWNLEPHYVMA
jgi:hypothetical protein